MGFGSSCTCVSIKCDLTSSRTRSCRASDSSLSEKYLIHLSYQAVLQPVLWCYRSEVSIILPSSRGAVLGNAFFARTLFAFQLRLPIG